jgi:bifunctional DNA-binding transcriptional regulator/antitoxin component of YhaV-PrlF toxin-antitoxin module
MTLPAELRDYLQLEENDVVTARKEDGRVILESPLHELRQALAESAKHFEGVSPLEPEEMRRLAADSIAEEGMNTLRQIELDRQND